MNAFAGDPQPVEIHHLGIWYSGEMLGWRHEGEGRVVARVRCVVDGLRHSTWKDLTELRLPDPRRPPRRERFPAAPAATRSTDEPEDDSTRPHVMLAEMRKRAPKPAHAVAPPTTEPTEAAVPRPVERELARWDRPLPEWRSPRPGARELAELTFG